MPADPNLLTTRAECDEADADLDAEIDGYQYRDTGIDFRDRQAGRTQTEVSGALAGVNAEIASFTTSLAQSDLPTTLRRQYESKLRKANDRKDNLTERGEARTGSGAYLAAVDADQVAAQVQVLTDAKAAVAARKAALPA